MRVAPHPPKNATFLSVHHKVLARASLVAFAAEGDRVLTLESKPARFEELRYTLLLLLALLALDRVHVFCDH